MHHTIKYDVTSLKSEAKAIKDCKDWLGTKQFNKVVNIIKNDCGKTSRGFVVIGLALQGIQGYPAEVMISKYWSPQRTLDI